MERLMLSVMVLLLWKLGDPWLSELLYVLA